MNKKTLTALIILAVVLMAGIGFAIKHLYNEDDTKDQTAQTVRFIEHHELVEAVPSDAAFVFCVKDFGRACELLGDSVAVFNELTSGKFSEIVHESYPALRRAPAIISVHYSKDMPPLLVVKSPIAANDSTSNDAAKLLATADSSGLFSKVKGDLILISSSETIVNSSIRHMDEGHSILESNGFAEIASKAPGSDIIFASNAYTDNIFETFLSRRFRKRASFIKELATWTAFSINRHSSSEVSMSGELLYGSDPAYYMNVLRHAGTSSVEVAQAVPANVDFIIDLPLGNLTAYLKAYRNYLDAKTRLDKYEYALSKQKKESGKNAEEWAKSLGIKEIAVVNTHIAGKLRQVLLIKPGSKVSAESIRDFSPFAGYAQALFGDIFTGEDESSADVVNGWIVAGADDAVREYSKTLDETLGERLSANGLGDRIPSKGCGFWMYHSLTEDPNLIDASFSQPMAKGLRKVIKGVTFVPVTLAAMSSGDKMTLEMNLARTNISKSKAPAAPSRDTTLIIPGGPFKVMNSATGKMVTLYQNKHLSICLQDENGKDLWGIPFKFPMCGYVREVDFYKNEKLQYLFAADSKLYLIDRLGRFMGGFPVDLGKKIAVGPEVYDFAGSKDYTAMVLYKDNTVGMYDLSSKAPSSSFAGITAKETIKSLPELLAGEGTKYWIVRTSSQAIVYPFNGGEPLVQGEGNKMIRPDSKITINDKGAFVAKCYDGKERTFKLKKEKR